MKKFFFFNILLFSIFISSAQTVDKIDSLKVLLLKNKTENDYKARLLLNLAFYCTPVEGLHYANEALVVSKDIKNRHYEAIAWEYIGTKKRILGNYLEAVNAYITASKIYNEIGLADNEALIYLLLGANFTSNNDYVNGLKYLRMSLPLFRNQGDSSRVAETYINLGETFRNMNQLDSAEYYFEKSLGIYNIMDAKSEKFLSIGNLGLVHSSQKKYDIARKEINTAVEEFKKLNNPYYTSAFQSEMADIYINEGNIKEGKSLLYKSLEIAKNAKIKEQIRDISKKLAEICERENKFDEAIYHQKQYKLYDDSLKDVENVRAMEQQQSKFEVVKLEEEIFTLNRINKLQRSLSYSLAVSVALFLVFIFLLVRAIKTTKKANLELKQKKLLIENKEKEKALLLKELNHRVKNNLQMVASLLNLQARQLKGHPAAEALISCKYRVEALTLMHQKLYRDDVDTSIDLKAYIEELANNLVINFGQEFQLKLILESFRMNIDKAIPLGLILNEIVTNSLKYGKKDNDFPELLITVKNFDGKVILSISDNGKGLPEGFDWKTSNSFGLKLVHSLVSQLGGEIEYKNNNGSNWVLNLDKQKLI